MSGQTKGDEAPETGNNGALFSHSGQKEGHTASHASCSHGRGWAVVETTKTLTLLSFCSLPLGLLIGEIYLEAIGWGHWCDPVYKGTELRGEDREYIWLSSSIPETLSGRWPSRREVWLIIHTLGLMYIKCSEKAMAPHSSTLAWKIPWTEEPGRL